MAKTSKPPTRKSMRNAPSNTRHIPYVEIISPTSTKTSSRTQARRAKAKKPACDELGLPSPARSTRPSDAIIAATASLQQQIESLRDELSKLASSVSSSAIASSGATVLAKRSLSHAGPVSLPPAKAQNRRARSAASAKQPITGVEVERFMRAIIYVSGTGRRPFCQLRKLFTTAAVEQHWVQHMSFIGNDVLELVILNDHRQALIDRLAKRHVNIVDGFDPLDPTCFPTPAATSTQSEGERRLAAKQAFLKRIDASLAAIPQSRRGLRSFMKSLRKAAATESVNLARFFNPDTVSKPTPPFAIIQTEAYAGQLSAGSQQVVQETPVPEPPAMRVSKASSLGTRSAKLRIASYNAAGLLGKLDFIHALIKDNAVDILLVQETYFTAATDLPDSPFFFTHLPFARTEGMRSRNPHGLAIFVGERLLPFKDSITIEHEDERHQASITIRLSNLTVSNVYLPPSMSLSQWTATVLCLPVVAANQMHLIMGDWNVRLAGTTGDRVSNVRAPALRGILSAKSWAVVPFASTAPSFDDGRRTSKPDFAVCPSAFMSRCSGVKVLDRDNGGSDHFPILVEVSGVDWNCMPAGARRIAFSRLATNQHIRSSFSKLAHRDLVELAGRTSCEWQRLLHGQQAIKNSCVQRLLDTCTAGLNARLISAAERTVGYRKDPTIERYTFKDGKLKALVEARRRLLRILSVFKQTPVVRADLRKQLDHVNSGHRSRVEELTLLAKQRFYNSLEKKPMHEQLRIARFEANRRQRSGARLLSNEHVEAYADHFAKMFVYREQFRYDTTEAMSDNQQAQDATIVPISQQEYEAYSPHLSAAAMAVNIRRAPTGKAAGCSAVPAELLKPVAKSAAQVLSLIAEIMVRCGACPTAFKKANIVPVPKKAANADTKGYRPISLTEVPRRIIEKGFSAILLPFEEKLSPMQGGFRQQRSTVDQVAVLHQVVCQRLLKPTVLAFLDIRAAYDAVDRTILWKRCLSFGMPRTIVSVLQAMFDENQSRVVLEGACSRWFSNHVGLLQGSTLSPLLYAIFIDELAIQLRLKMPTVLLGDMRINSTLYADDIALIADSLETCQAMLDLCHVFARENRFEFGAQKCEILTARLPSQETTPLKLGAEEIPFCSRFKYLGVSFGAQGIDTAACVESLCKSIVGATAVLKSIGCRPSRYPLHILTSLFKAFVRSCGEYAIAVLPLQAAHVALLEQAQYKAVKMLLGTRAPISRLKLLAVLGLETVQLRRNILSAHWLHAATTKSTNFLVKHALIDFERKKQRQSCFHFPTQVNPAYRSFVNALAEDPSIELASFLRHYRSQIASKIAMDTGLIPAKIAALTSSTNTITIAKLLYRLGTRKEQLRLVILWITGCLPYAALPCRICGKDLSKAHAEACVLSSALREVGARGSLGTRLDNALLTALASQNSRLVMRLVDMLSITLKKCFPP